MKEENVFIYLMASLAILIPFPGRLAYGIILILLLNILMLTGTFFKRFVSLIALDNMLSVLVAILLVAEVILFKQFLILFSSVIALTVGFTLFLPAVSSFLLGNLYKQNQKTLISDLKDNMKQSGLFSLFAFYVFLFRDLFGYGTITFPAKNGITHFNIIPRHSGCINFFWASIPGALLLCLVTVLILFYFRKNIEKAGLYLKQNGGSK